jgi:predicted metal-dependent hydrolase
MYYIFILILILYLCYSLYNINIIQIKSIEGFRYTIYNNDIEKKTEIINNIINNMNKLKEHLYNNIDNFPEFKIYIIQLNNNFNINRTQIYETNPYSKLTSYSVNKGEELSICIKSKKTDKYHDINLLMYVIIHEMAHFACPEIGHGELFKKIFKFFLIEAINIGIYKKVDYSLYPIEYCGMELNSSII